MNHRLLAVRALCLGLLVLEGCGSGNAEVSLVGGGSGGASLVAKAPTATAGSDLPTLEAPDASVDAGSTGGFSGIAADAFDEPGMLCGNGARTRASNVTTA